MTGYHIVGLALVVIIAAFLVWAIERWPRHVDGAQRAVDEAEKQTWGGDEMDQRFEEARRVLDAQKLWTCPGRFRNAGHNQGCPAVQSHRAVREGGES